MKKLLLCCSLLGCANAGNAAPGDEEADSAIAGEDAIPATDSDVVVIDTGAIGADSTTPTPDAKAETTPPLPGIAFPFPQNRPSSWCSYPSYSNADVKALYETFKSKFVTSSGANGFRRVQRPEDGGDTVSEGIAYGMMIAVYMADQSLFDDLWKYSQKHVDSHGLMDWKISPDGGTSWGTGGATDADEDIAWALVMAGKQWGASYTDLAKAQIDRIWSYEVDHARGDVLKGGDNWTEDRTNPSYLSPAYYRVFGKVTGKTSDWNKVVDSSYKVLAADMNGSTGLVTDWCAMSGSPYGDAYYYDAARTPFRIGLDYCLFGEPKAKAFLDKIGGFFVSQGAANIRDGYNVGGGKTGGNESPVFTGPAAVGAMGLPSGKSFVNDAYGRIVALGKAGDLRYYAGSWAMISLLATSGNFLDYTAY